MSLDSLDQFSLNCLSLNVVQVYKPKRERISKCWNSEILRQYIDRVYLKSLGLKCFDNIWGWDNCYLWKSNFDIPGIDKLPHPLLSPFKESGIPSWYFFMYGLPVYILHVYLLLILNSILIIIEQSLNFCVTVILRIPR